MFEIGSHSEGDPEAPVFQDDNQKQKTGLGVVQPGADLAGKTVIEPKQ